VEQFLTNLITQTEGLAAYGLVFGVLVACGLGVPLPEDVSLITGGFLAYLGAADLPIMIAVGFAGILCGDTIIFFAGRRIGSQVGRGGGFFGRIVTSEKRAIVERLFARHGEKIVMVARFLPGVRAVTYFTAGSARMKYLRFILWDGLAALGSAPLFVYLGYHFGDELERLVRAIRRGETAVIIVVVAALVALIVIKRRRNRAARKAIPDPSAARLAEPSPNHPDNQESRLDATVEQED
jgi:membrane protein DedA with SNARE-associated domain